MNIKIFKKINKKLNESSDIDISTNQAYQMNSVNKVDVQKYQDIFDTDENFVKFDCGCMMPKVNTPIDSRFGLKFHILNTKSFEEFLESVENFIHANPDLQNYKLTDNDIKKLSEQYKLL